MLKNHVVLSVFILFFIVSAVSFAATYYLDEVSDHELASDGNDGNGGSDTTITSTRSMGVKPLRVNSNGRYFETDTRPFYWQADTGWHLIELTPSEIDKYLAARASSNFNVIQGPIVIRTVPFADFTTLNQAMAANYAGEVIFSSTTPLILNETYLQHVDYIVDKANEYGLYVALPVVWGALFDIVFDVNNPTEAYDIGFQLGQRYMNKDNVIWIVSGEYQKISWEIVKRDRTVPTQVELDLIQQLAEGLEAGHGGNNLMTIHPDGGKSSSEHFHDAAWLDFNMIQTFVINNQAATLVENDWNQSPSKPVINAEGAYEDRDRGIKNDPVTAWKVRYEAYTSVFQGASGHTYGHSDIWQAKDADGQFVDTNGRDWWLDLKAEGAEDMKHLRALVESRPILTREPLQSAILDQAGNYRNLERVYATGDSNGGYLFIYFPQEKIGKTIDLTLVNGSTLNAWWFNPRDGQTYKANGDLTTKPFATYDNSAMPQKLFNPPGNSATQDWVLVLDDATRSYAVPGRTNGAPTAVGDSGTTNQDAAVVIDVLGNDTDPERDALNVSFIIQGTNGAVTNNNTDVTYTPNTGFSGADLFTYTVSDSNGGFDTATVNVTVTSTVTNQAPTAVDDTSTTEQSVPVKISLLGNDFDNDDDILSITKLDKTSVGEGTITNNGDGTVIYTSASDFSGNDNFSYTVSDGNGADDTAMVTVSVTPAPTPGGSSGGGTSGGGSSSGGGSDSGENDSGEETGAGSFDLYALLLLLLGGMLRFRGSVSKRRMHKWTSQTLLDTRDAKTSDALDYCLSAGPVFTTLH